MESGTPQDRSSGDSHMQKAHAQVVCPEAGAGFRATASLALGRPGSPRHFPDSRSAHTPRIYILLQNITR